MRAVPVASERADGDAGRPAATPLSSLFPGGRIRPGTAVSAGGDMPLLLALAAEASAGSAGWAAVGLPQLGALAAADAGLDLGAGMWVDEPGPHWPQVLATVVEAVPVVMVGALGPVPDRIGRRLSALLRRSGSILLAANAWAGAELRLAVTTATWEGVGSGYGLLRGRRARVISNGRGAAAEPRQADLWLPGPNGAAEPFEAPAGPGQQAEAVAALTVAERRAALRVVG
ncbi:hypothetical protein [Streptomyces sp. NPDC050485]|uniref:hypothetical protein n=1 Tax=Streptomyces sp. NPDC050485 TaxID=3365617 RepID=UPI0037A2198F